ncbi:MAG TPA: acetyl-CoA C-acyltransferase [Vicinamibacterales bacterium]|nr:acetyl-CoA C-acyltransferase [Vicinamibacterales bacterium]
MTKDIYILGGARTPMAEYTGKLKDFSAIELGALAARAALARTGVSPGEVDHVVFGNVLQTSADAVYGARHVGLKAGVPVEVPALTVNRLCGSGVQAAISSAQMILLDEAEIVLSGGMESMSQAPHVIRGLRSGLRLGQGQLEDSLWTALMDTHCGCTMAATAENCAARYAIPREEQDCYAVRSQQLADRAWREGRLGEEVVPVEIKSRRGVETFAQDDHMRADSTVESLSKLPPAFSRDGCVTAGNASGIVDGGAALLLASASAVRSRGLTPLARLTHWATVGVEPTLMGMGPAPAARKVLDAAGLGLKDMDLIEINEAFAAQYLAVEKELGLDRERVNVNGGAIALGHPLGATGARLMITLLNELERTGLSMDDIDLFEVNEAFASVVLAWAKELDADLDRVNVNGGGIALGHPIGATGTRLMTTLLHELERTGGRYGLQTMCEGGGQANVTIIERL